MHTKNFRIINLLSICFFIFAGMAAGQSQTPEETLFPTPAILKDNIAFWKKIYVEVSLKEGLIHDKEYPLVIYEKIAIGDKRGSQRTLLLRKHFNAIKASLRNINSKPEAKWTAEERRIAVLFETHASTEQMKTAAARIRFQQGQRERFKEGLERSGAYLSFIRSVFAEYNIPEKIAYLPHVESSFNPQAYSKAGAAGMWQFMRGTGRLFLRVDYSVDERWDPYMSTVAAAKLLKKNYEETKSWPLALTAYNHGLESIINGVNKTGSRDIGTIIQEYKNRRFRFASRNFYSCFLAVSEIAASPARYFPNLVYHLPLQFSEVTLDSYISPGSLVEYLGVSQEDLVSLNPALRPVIFQRQFTIPKGYVLRLPASISSSEAVEKIAAIPTSLKKKESDMYRYYSVRKGDTLHRISLRFGVSTKALFQANKVGPKGRIYIGQVLKIPGKSSKSRPRETVSPPPEKAKDTVPAAPVEKTIPKTGESLAREIRQAQQLPVPSTAANQDGETSSPAFDATLYHLDIRVYQDKGTARITVSVDETLGHYADWLGIPTQRIRDLNRLGRRSIRINQRLLMPVDQSSLEPFKTRRLEYHMSLEEDFYANYRVEGVASRTVGYGESLWSICAEEDIPLWLFKKYNRDIDIEKVRVNTTVRLPIVKNRD